MRNIANATCFMLAFSAGAHAMDASVPEALSTESVPPAVQSLQAAPLALTREEAPVVSIGENEAPRARPVIVVRLQSADPVMSRADGQMAALLADAEYEQRRLDRLERFVKLALRNSRNHADISQDWLFEKPAGLPPTVHVFASNNEYGLGLGWGR